MRTRRDSNPSRLSRDRDRAVLMFADEIGGLSGEPEEIIFFVVFKFTFTDDGGGFRGELFDVDEGPWAFVRGIT